MNSITLNGVSSTTIRGLLIQSLPPISKPAMRVQVEEIDGRDGDIVTDIGYQAYDKSFMIGLYGAYDVDQVIAFFASSGEVIFSNETDKVYRYKTISAIDFERLIRFKQATVTLHVQPYKTSALETPESVESTSFMDSEPYLFRQAPDGADMEIDEIVGGSIVWNQLMRTSQLDASKTQNGVTITDNRDGTYTVSTDANGATANTYSSLSNANIPITNGHKYLLFGTPTTGSANTYYSYIAGTATAYDYGKGVVFSANANGTSTPVVAYVKQGAIIATPITLKPQVSDLTRLFGPTIADYIYTQEQASAGAGVALAKALAGITADYYPYDPGSIKSVTGLTAHKMTGFNQWDEEWENGRFNLTTGEKSIGNGLASKNKIRVLPNTTYYANCGAGYGSALIFLYYDADENLISYEIKYSLKTSFTTPSNACYVNFNFQSSSAVTTYKNDICINFSDPSKNGTYEPYDGHVYPLDSSLTLRGLLKLDGDSIYYDGDIYPPSGEVERRYGVRAYQSGDESDANVITDGTNTVYKLTTPTTEQAEPYTNPQVVLPGGTEEYITDRESPIPVGHNTKYIVPIDVTVTNVGNTNSEPIMTIEGSGTINVSVNGSQIFTIDMGDIGEITIDAEALEAYSGSTLMNRRVTGDYSNFVLHPGENTIEVSGDASNVTIERYSRWI